VRGARIIVMAGCISAMCHAAAADQTPAREDRAYRASTKTARPVHKPAPKAIVPKTPAKRPVHSSLNPAAKPALVPNGSFLAGKSAASQNASVGSIRPVRRSSPPHTAEPLASNPRHRSPNPAIISGSIDARKNILAIDGRQVNRKP
jgi:hypothetical protein